MTRDHIQAILLLGFLVEKGLCKLELSAHLNIDVEVEGEKHELRGFVMEGVPLGIKVIPLFSPDGRTVALDAEKRLSEAARELVCSGRQFCTPWRNYEASPVILWAHCGRC